MRYKDGLQALHGGTPGARSSWRWFPWAITAAMLVVIGVNIGMVYAAMHSFPGAAGGDGFDLSNRYDRVIDQVQRQAALGWSLQASADALGHPVLLLHDRAGAPLAGAVLRGTAERPVGPQDATALAFQELAPGRYVAQLPLSERGQWDLLVSATAEGHRYTTTRRIMVR
ncbi:MAG TPA: FixH family protein [Acetobacteraceae bacterium]|nr:FixH family protein [Acetobacteraceae bacterium]